MLYTVGYNNEYKSVIVKDTDDGVVDFLPLSDLAEVTKSIPILGVFGSTFVTCVEHGVVITYVDMTKNELVIYNKITDSIQRIPASQFKEKRNTPIMCSVKPAQFNSRNYMAFRVDFYTKYDIEFGGIAFVLLHERNGVFVDNTDIYYVMDNASVIRDIVNNTGGDCPTFTPSSKVPFDSTNAMFNGIKRQ